MNNLLQNEIEDMEVQQGFKIDSLESANWAFRKIRALKADVEEKEQLAKSEKERIDTWLKNEAESAQNSINFFQGLLTEYYLKLRKDNPKAKISTPYGKVASRKSKTWIYKDEEEILKHLNFNGYNNLIRVKEELNKTEIKKTFEVKNGMALDKKTGEIIPGISVTEEENISIKVE